MGSKPASSGAGGVSTGAASGAGGRFGSKPTASGPAAAFGSKPASSALAIPAGDLVTNVPAIAAAMSVVRAFFNVVPFAVRARQSQPTGMG
ncbi:hypothetical protein [Mycobacterium tuberculosis]|uniref:hypothetical protein n=1 Tax=Mycobacterium tuberculosis TaxID=1773 RepID=UPI0002D280EB|nr:hypothetical protein BTB1458_2724 [Mycobacterium tuberculosis]QIE93650.1 hypothetical protein G5V64_11675 [Mycobacterium tuberculosis]QOM97270.1 hypothetical protein FPJ94_12135 [Mycobacterium tuberculosis]